MSLHYLGKQWTTRNCVFSVMLGIHRDHPHRQIRMKFCVVSDLQEIVLRFEFYQNRLSSFGAVWGQNLPFSIDLAVFPPMWLNQWERANFDPPSPTAVMYKMLLIVYFTTKNLHWGVSQKHVERSSVLSCWCNKNSHSSGKLVTLVCHLSQIK